MILVKCKLFLGFIQLELEDSFVLGQNNMNELLKQVLYLSFPQMGLNGFQRAFPKANFFSPILTRTQ